VHLDVKLGDLGGYVQSEANLSQEGDCWITFNAKAYGKARITGNALLLENADVCNRAQVSQDARVGGKARLRDCAHVFDKAEVSGTTLLTGIAKVGEERYLCAGEVNS
jgi:hypothetical protein